LFVISRCSQYNIDTHDGDTHDGDVAAAAAAAAAVCVCVHMCSGAVALDGRIEPGDMILEVNGVSFENLSNDEAVRILRDVVQKSGLAAASLLSVLQLNH